MIRRWSLLRDESGAGAVEFAMVLPLVLIFLLGLIDTGRFMWNYNEAEKATQMGVRYAVVTNPVLDGIDTFSFATDDNIPAGDPIPTDNFEKATCDDAGCDCEPNGGEFCTAVAYDPAAFAEMVDRMTAMYPAIAPEDVTVEYRNVGLGYSGDPNGPDVAPLVTVRLTDLEFIPITFVLFGGSITMPVISAGLTLEDGAGTAAN